ncbi:flavodoxin [Enterococcus pseudoavium]|uniref:Flavodoxin n=1 Tax=Enterococcus pseudoavium TaxID=44007 RepID=A0AAE4HZV7_9ENTE|nr:flavodoxin [Enterococcus pseudoavium]MDT2736551.1 flavodoxin [Enterococcus pseudoavium]MDT2755034.1 flavodoxin [Enterococcus pseudoavium]MDT2770885.1 flavodoxin [Enterococcus pseudoavium]REC26499.1 flavodoxin [Enterococcus pseudoavium]REC31783.1 flavodoxin [Enterococcus pseudoavium]
MTLAKIVYASNTGNTEGISEILEDAFTALDIEVERVEADDAEADFYEDADICVLATYTDGDGELPFDLEDLHEELPDEDLSGKVYGVVGSGDSELYPDYFCQAAITFDDAFAKTGAKKAADTVKIENEADDDDEEILKTFVKSLVEAAE